MFFCVQWFGVSVGFSVCWYMGNCSPWLFKLSFPDTLKLSYSFIYRVVVLKSSKPALIKVTSRDITSFNQRFCLCWCQSPGG
jgi:hypothetical protein